MSVREKIIEELRGFRWSWHGFDGVALGLADYPDEQRWLGELADRICAAIDDDGEA